MKLEINLDNITADDWGTSVGDIIKAEVVAAVRGEIRATVKDVLKNHKKRILLTVVEWLDHEIGGITNPDELKKKIKEMKINV